VASLYQSPDRKLTPFSVVSLIIEALPASARPDLPYQHRTALDAVVTTSAELVGQAPPRRPEGAAAAHGPDPAVLRLEVAGLITAAGSAASCRSVIGRLSGAPDTTGAVLFDTDVDHDA
jgi:hypothetical protein